MIVAPLSTIGHWHWTFANLTDLNAIIYYGTADDRALIRYGEFSFPEDRVEIDKFGFTKRYLAKVQDKWPRKWWEKIWMVEVVITTPEMIKAEDWKELSCIQWEILVVDEGHRLKNHRSGLAKTLRDDFMFKQSLLLTGTPVQNNMEEVSLFGSTRK